jgi:GT2 family glycosyltransferase
LCPVDDSGLDFEKKKYYIFHSTGFKRIKDKRKNSLYKGGLSFNGLLLPVYVVRKIGFLNEDFFVGREDFDFYHRIYDEGGYVLRVPQAQVFHNMYKETKKITLFNSIFLFPLQSKFREYYSYRNSVYTSKQKGVPLWKLYLRHIIGLLLTVFFRNSKMERLKNRQTAFKNGLQGQLGK